jgi:hypothetical protein
VTLSTYLTCTDPGLDRRNAGTATFSDGKVYRWFSNDGNGEFVFVGLRPVRYHVFGAVEEFNFTSPRRAELLRKAVTDLTSALCRASDDTALSAERFVVEWDAHGRKNGAIPIAAWERPYQASGWIEQAQRQGYIRISGNVACDITIESRGERLLLALKTIGSGWGSRAG